MKKKIYNFYLVFLFFVPNQSLLFAQRLHGLIDASPVIVNKNDFKPPISITIKFIDSITNSSLNAKINYYSSGDSITKDAKGKTITIGVIGNENILIVSNTAGYLMQIQSFKTPVSDTTFVLKFKKLEKDNNINLNFVSVESETENKVAPDIQAYAEGMQTFLKLNSKAKIEIASSFEEVHQIYSRLPQNISKKRVQLRIYKRPRRSNKGTIEIRILHV